MTKLCDKPLRTNPFMSYRDPKTGVWVVVTLKPLKANLTKANLTNS
ncbi:hypothetical protein IFO70_13710 [Phormidium tenue FACHB-886]|nr:hypothetical protein [Phormidium tenue FACHB-886]